MPLSIDKLKCIYQSVGAVNAEYFSYVFPIFRYHNRWKEISKIDYTYDKLDKTNYTKGYLETQSVTETEVTLKLHPMHFLRPNVLILHACLIRHNALEYNCQNAPILLPHQLNITVLYLKEAFRRQKPKVVALEINMIV